MNQCTAAQQHTDSPRLVRQSMSKTVPDSLVASLALLAEHRPLSQFDGGRGLLRVQQVAERTEVGLPGGQVWHLAENVSYSAIERGEYSVPLRAATYKAGDLSQTELPGRGRSTEK